MKLANKPFEISINIFIFVMMFVLLQNCVASFETVDVPQMQVSSEQGGLTETPPETEPVKETPSTETPTTGTEPRPPQKPSFLYVGGQRKITAFRILPQEESVEEIQQLSLELTPGWFVSSSDRQKVYVADASGTRLEILSFDSRTDRLGRERTLPFLGHVVHLELMKGPDYEWLAGASYDQGKLGLYQIPPGANVAKEIEIKKYASHAQTHSSSFDPSRDLLFVANKEENRIAVSKVTSQGLIEVGEIQVSDPRLVTFDSTYNRLYVTTEAPVGESSQVKIYTVEVANNRVQSQEVGTFSMDSRGSDLRIDHTHRFLGTTVRHAGKEGIWMLPLTAQGHFETTREKVFLPIRQQEARPLEIADGGRLYIVTCNHPQNNEDVIIYRVDYNEKLEVTSSKIIKEIAVGAGSFVSHFLLEPK